jgi:parallel beta-helix repeat protein
VITVGPKGCDFYRIEAALGAAEPGDVIEVHSGEYWANLNITMPFVVLRGNDTGGGMPVLRAGSSTADIENIAPGTSILEERTGGTAIAIRADFVTVEGFVITGVTWPKPYGTEEHNDLIGNAGIRVYSDFNKIANNTFTGNDLTAIGLWNCTNNQILGNTIKDVSFGYGIQLYNASMNTIEKNILNHNSWGIELQRSDTNTFNQNEIQESVNSGIRAVNCNFTTLTENIISRNGHESKYEGTGKGVSLVGSYGMIADNIISFNRDDGVYVESIIWEFCSQPPCGSEESYENLIIDNKIQGNGRDGIRLEKTWKNLIWKNNLTSNHGKGISFVQSHNNSAELNNINKSDYGVYLDRSNYTRISNNTVKEAERSGIYLWSCTGASADNNTLTDSPDGITIDEAGIKNALIGNRVSNSTDGINISGRSSENWIDRNVVISCETGVRLGDAIRNTVAGNEIADNLLGLALSAASSGNSVYGNNLSNNGEAARDEGDNRWDDEFKGNYYGSADCEDANNDGICDVPQPIPGGNNVDRYSLARF